MSDDRLKDAVTSHEASRQRGYEQGARSVWMRLLADAVSGAAEGADLEALRELRAALKAEGERVDVLIERAITGRR